MKYMKHINSLLAIAFVLGSVTLFAPQAKADLSIMNPGLYPSQVYPGYSGPVIMAQPTYPAVSVAPVIPDLYAMTPSNPVYTPSTPTQTQTTVVTQPTVVYQPAPTTTVVQTQPTTTSTVKGTTIHAPTVNGIKTTPTTSVQNINASSNLPGICSGDTVHYTLNYANTTGGTINNAMLIVSMPAEVDYVNATAQASYNDRNRTVTIFIGTLTKGQTGVVYLDGSANRNVNGVGTVMTRTDFTYVKANGVSETTTNYVMHSGTNCANNLGANVLGSGFLPTSFGGWVLLAVILCAIIFIVRKFFGSHGHAHGGHMEHAAH
jgi:hypothetical protein